jgi:AcrR family transcriptional regulator
MKMNDTKTRILDTAERLFAEKGYSATSLRHIIREAGVNLAAIHYHFHTKEDLLEAVVLRGATPLNQERLALLARFEREAGGRPPVEKILEALLAPTFRVAHDWAESGVPFARLMGRLHAEGDVLLKIAKKNFGPVLAAFISALRRALPGLPEKELLWRMDFVIGAMSHTLRSAHQVEYVFHGTRSPADLDATLRCLIDFLSAGLRSPATTRARARVAEVQEVRT